MTIPSLAQIITDIENDIQTTEADVWNWVSQIQTGIAVLEGDLTSGLQWIASVAPAWVQDIAAVMAVAQAIPGLQIPAAVITATTAAAAALTAVANAEAAGKSTPATLVSAYSAMVGVVQAKTVIQAIVTAAPTPVVAPIVQSNPMS